MDQAEAQFNFVLQQVSAHATSPPSPVRSTYIREKAEKWILKKLCGHQSKWAAMYNVFNIKGQLCVLIVQQTGLEMMRQLQLWKYSRFQLRHVHMACGFELPVLRLLIATEILCPQFPSLQNDYPIDMTCSFSNSHRRTFLLSWVSYLYLLPSRALKP